MVQLCIQMIKILKMKKIITILALTGISSILFAQGKIFGYMEPGEYKVGLQIVKTYDNGRTFGPQSADDEEWRNNARPMQILVWYPATGEGNPLSYQDYILTGFSEVDFTPLSDEMKERFIGMHKNAFIRNGADSARIASMLNRKSFAVPNLKATEGNFPLVVYSPGGNERCYENFILAEYLASHGYIVASIALTGDDSQLMKFEPAEYENSVDDILFVISFMQNFPNVNRSRMGLVGFCWGSMVNVMVANRNANVDVLVDLFGANNDKATREKIETYRYSRLKNPTLAYMQLAGSPEERDNYFLENYLYGGCFQVRYENISHNAFTSNYVSRYHYYKDKLPGNHTEQYTDTIDNCYKNTCKYTLGMLNAYLKKDEKAKQNLMKMMNSEMNGEKHLVQNAMPLPLNSAEFMKVVKEQGVNEAIRIYNEVRSKDKSWRLFQENAMINYGYTLIAQKNIDDAIELFNLVLNDFPDSWNVYDSLGEAWFMKGDKEKARKYLEKSVELLPANTHAKEILHKL